jgi:hypothetical protein
VAASAAGALGFWFTLYFSILHDSCFWIMHGGNCR